MSIGVDDNELSGDLLKRGLEMHGFEVTMALDGRAGLERARREKPDLIIMDLSNPMTSLVRPASHATIFAGALVTVGACLWAAFKKVPAPKVKDAKS